MAIAFLPLLVRHTITFTCHKRDFVWPILYDSKLSFCSEQFISVSGIKYYKSPGTPVNGWWKSMRVKLWLSQRCLVPLISSQACSSLMNLLFLFSVCRFYSSPYSIATNRMIPQTSITPFIAASPVSTYQVCLIYLHLRRDLSCR